MIRVTANELVRLKTCPEMLLKFQEAFPDGLIIRDGQHIVSLVYRYPWLGTSLGWYTSSTGVYWYMYREAIDKPLKVKAGCHWYFVDVKETLEGYIWGTFLKVTFNGFVGSLAGTYTECAFLEKLSFEADLANFRGCTFSPSEGMGAFRRCHFDRCHFSRCFLGQHFWSCSFLNCYFDGETPHGVTYDGEDEFSASGISD